jgi:hypothetical protein
MTIRHALLLLLLTACGGTRTARDTSAASGPGPDFNGGFDRRPLQSYALADGGTAYEWPTSIPDGWTMEAGAWSVGVFALYGEGYGGGTPIMCTAADGRPHACAGTGAAPNNSALSAGVCWAYNGGCAGANILRTAPFPVSGGAAYILSAFVRGRVDFSDFSGEMPGAGLVFQFDWLAGSSPIGTERIPDNLPLTLDWLEHRFTVDAPPGATQAALHIELARAKRDVRVDNVTLVPQ